MTYRILAAALTLCLSITATAEVYKTIDENGKVIFTDNPQGKKAEKVELPPINSQPATPVFTPPKSADKPKAIKPVMQIRSPKSGAQIPTGQHQIPVSIGLRPKLKAGQTIQMLINGQPFGSAQASTQFVLKDVFRGEHQLSAQLRDPNGKVLMTSRSVTIYVQRHRVGQ